MDSEAESVASWSMSRTSAATSELSGTISPAGGVATAAGAGRRCACARASGGVGLSAVARGEFAQAGRGRWMAESSSCLYRAAAQGRSIGELCHDVDGSIPGRPCWDRRLSDPSRLPAGMGISLAYIYFLKLIPW
jgi:hypothetical protein